MTHGYLGDKPVKSLEHYSTQELDWLEMFKLKIPGHNFSSFWIDKFFSSVESIRVKSLYAVKQIGKVSDDWWIVLFAWFSSSALFVPYAIQTIPRIRVVGRLKWAVRRDSHFASSVHFNSFFPFVSSSRHIGIFDTHWPWATPKLCSGWNRHAPAATISGKDPYHVTCHSFPPPGLTLLELELGGSNGLANITLSPWKLESISSFWQRKQQVSSNGRSANAVWRQSIVLLMTRPLSNASMKINQQLIEDVANFSFLLFLFLFVWCPTDWKPSPRMKINNT